MLGMRVVVCVVVAVVVVLSGSAGAWPGYGSRAGTSAPTRRQAEVTDEAPGEQTQREGAFPSAALRGSPPSAHARETSVAPEILSASHPLLFTASHAALQSYLSKPDCFRDAVPLTDCDMLEREPEARVRGELVLTSHKRSASV